VEARTDPIPALPREALDRVDGGIRFAAFDFTYVLETQLCHPRQLRLADTVGSALLLKNEAKAFTEEVIAHRPLSWAPPPADTTRARRT
jgi:hypothetical protein